MRDDLTVVYVTSNREDPAFECRIQKTLLEATDGIQLISVSQKPIDLGKNICIGDVGAKPENVLKQMIIGAKEAATKFIAIAEADFLYPKEFFEFVPPTDDTFYYPDNVYILWINHNRFFPKKIREMLSVTNREHFVKILETVASRPFEHIVTSVKGLTKQDTFHTEIPLVTFKTREGMHWRSPFSRDGSKKVLPQWGSAQGTIRRYVG